MASLKRLFSKPKSKPNSRESSFDYGERCKSEVRRSQDSSQIRYIDPSELESDGDSDDDLPMPRISVSFGPVETSAANFKPSIPKSLKISEEVAFTEDAGFAYSFERNSEKHRRTKSLNFEKAESLDSGSKSKIRSQGFKLSYGFDTDTDKRSWIGSKVSASGVTPASNSKFGKDTAVKAPDSCVHNKDSRAPTSDRVPAPRRHLRKSISLGEGDFAFILEAAKETFTEVDFQEAKCNLKETWKSTIQTESLNFLQCGSTNGRSNRRKSISRDDGNLPEIVGFKLMY